MIVKDGIRVNHDTVSVVDWSHLATPVNQGLSWTLAKLSHPEGVESVFARLFRTSDLAH